MADPTRNVLVPVNLTEALGERYISYALSTIVSRSLPDVRDGLKPVHRRLLYAMYELHLTAQSTYKKSARVVGDVVGKFHPHGDVAVYETLVRLAQDFSLRYPLVDGQGNFGSIDGDNAAAMRYTEARLTKVAEYLLQDIDDETVDWNKTYDGELQEPVILPAAFPNFLANGASGIAVGMATSVPPHNVAELMEAACYLIDKPQAKISELLSFIQGPDLPTGGTIIESKASILDTYETGRGSFRVRACYRLEPIKYSAPLIVVYEIPYQVQKAKLIEKIALLLSQKKLPLLDDVRDESTEETRLVLVPKSRDVDPEVLMESLYQQTDLEVRLSLNMNVLTAERIPQLMNLKQALQAYIDHRRIVIRRKADCRLRQVIRRLEILEGYHIAYINLDEVIQIIREEDDPKAVMMQKWQLTDLQSEAILDMKLRTLRKLHEVQIRQEIAHLTSEQEGLTKLLQDDKVLNKTVKKSFLDLKKDFDYHTPLGARRTKLLEELPKVDMQITASVPDEEVTIICSQLGWLKTVKGHAPQEIRYKEGDSPHTVIYASTIEKLNILASDGRVFTLDVYKIPGGKGYGQPLSSLVDWPQGAHHYLFTTRADHQGKFLLASDKGQGFIIQQSDLIANTRAGKQVLVLKEGEYAKFCFEVTKSHIAFIGANRKLLIVKAEEVPTLSKGRGVILQKYKDGGLNDAITLDAEKDMMCWAMGERQRAEKELTLYVGTRGNAGRLAPLGFSISNTFQNITIKPKNG